MSTTPDVERLRNDWLHQLSELVDRIRHWADELDWSTRPIEVTLRDSQLGKYQAPALLMQKEAVRVLLEPVARSAPGAEGVVDLYLMPSYDDIASLYLREGDWRIHYMFPGTPTVPTISEADSRPLTKRAIQDVLEEMKKNAV